MMMSEMQADDKADRVIRDRIARAKAIAGYFPKFNRSDIDIDGLADLTARMAHDAKVLDALVGEALATASEPLPAPALTEQAIVDALKADPAMAGRVAVQIGVSYSVFEREAFGRHAKELVGTVSGPGARCVQSLGLDLAAASYRG